METSNINTQKLSDVLSDFIAETDSIVALLLNKDGTAIASAGSENAIDTTAMAALIAGMFSATREVAKMVGEHQFSILLQQGEKRHIHISLVNEHVMMAVVFEGFHRIGRIRYESRKACKTIGAALAITDQTNNNQKVISIPEFKEVALNLIDSIFTNK
ncbi:MAG: roadblock/LC7 domain-containing protein [Deltaproteobacteria bacterium]|nr:roadblock/LC7 domain-containing protein [Deltaproteobacteria bacterium]